MFMRILKALAYFANEARRRNVLWVSVPSILPAPIATAYSWLSKQASDGPLLVVLVAVWLLITLFSWFIGFKDGRFVVWQPVIPGARARRRVGVAVGALVLAALSVTYVVTERRVSLMMRKGAGTEAYANVLEVQLTRGLVPQRVRLVPVADTPKDGDVLETSLSRVGNQILVSAVLRRNGQATAQLTHALDHDDPIALNRLVKQVGQELVRNITPFVRRRFLPQWYLRSLAESREAFSAISEGMLALEDANYLSADSAFERALEADPNSFEALGWRGIVYTRMGLTNSIPADSAFVTARKFFAQAPNTAETLRAQGEIELLHRWEADHAETLFRNSAQMGGDLSELRRLQGLMFLSRGQLRRARGAMEEAVALAPGDALQARANWGIVLYYAEKYDSAYAVMQDVLHRNARRVNPSRDVERRAQLWTILSAARLRNSRTVERTFSEISLPNQRDLLATAQARAILGDRESAKVLIDSLNRVFCPQDPRLAATRDCAQTRPAYWTAAYHASIGQQDSALHWLGVALEDCRKWDFSKRGCDQQVRFIRLDPAFERYRTSSTYNAMLKRFHAPFAYVD